MLLLRARAVHAMTREILFLLFHLQRNTLQVFLLESFSQRILISCELFIYGHPKQMSMVICELNKSGYSFRISKCSLSGFTDHSLAPTLIRMTPSSFLFYCSLCSNEFTRHSFTMQSFFQNVVLAQWINYSYLFCLKRAFFLLKRVFTIMLHRLWKNSNQKDLSSLFSHRETYKLLV